MAFFKILSNCLFTTSREEHYSAYNMKVIYSLFCLQDIAQSVLENFGFHNEYDDEYEKTFIIFWTLQTNFCDSAHVEWLLGPCGKKVVADCQKWTR